MGPLVTTPTQYTPDVPASAIPVQGSKGQPFRAPAGQLRNPLGELLCGYYARNELCLALDPCPDHPSQPALDLHPLLKDDEQAWSVRSRLTTSLGRPALATRLADALPALLGAELADRLDTLITQALTEQQAQITQELSDRYHEARARLDADAAIKLKEVHDERYRGHSRFS